MKTINIIGLGVILVALFACEQPFKAGLGKVVDTRPPTVELHSPGVDEYIRGVTVFEGVAEDDYKLEKVEFRVTNFGKDGNPYYDWHLAELQPNGKWSFTIDTVYFTEMFGDGDLMLQVRAVDSDKKEGVTGDLAFHIKNLPPEISLGLPVITKGEGDGELGGSHLNYAAGGVHILPNPLVFPRKLDAEGIIVGMIRDGRGIGFTDIPAENKFPPQYRLWMVSDQGLDLSWPPEVVPDLPWKNFELDDNLKEAGNNSYTFTIDLVQEGIVSDQFYALQLRAQSVDGSWFFYPQGYWQEPEWDIENSYALMYMRSPQESPVLELYKFENIVGKDAWNSVTGTYNDIPDVDKSGKHPYVNQMAVTKNGPFTLRVRASHSDGISSAVVYWERNDGKRGRFIWDPASDSPYDGWNKQNTVSADRPYSEWGYGDPHSSTGIAYTARSFIFTYKGDGSDTVPVQDSGGTLFPANLRGKSKIHVFTGTNAEWANKLTDRWPFVPELDDSYWDSGAMSRLDPGTYNLEIWTASATGTKISSPLVCTISIDETPPDITLNSIEGSYAEGSVTWPGSALYTVNGVVRPRLLFAESEPSDSGFRTATQPYFQREGASRFGYEQRFILVAASDADKMTNYLYSTPWPEVPDSPSSALVIPGVTVRAHGPVFDSRFLIKTSPIANDDGDYLEDGIYMLYVFGRDNAFNVGWRGFPIEVKASTDIPVIDLNGTIKSSVKDPNISADWPASDEGKGFVVNTASGKAVVNKMTSSTTIRVRIKDDDSLDLGTSPMAGSAWNVEKSGVKVKFAGSSCDANGTITAYEGDYLDDSVVKAIFGFQEINETTGKRFAVKEKQGEITQQMLLTVLKGNSQYHKLFGIEAGDSEDLKAEKQALYNSLPNGIYRITISVADYNDPDIKLIMNGSLDKAQVAVTETEFWIAVDSTSPVAEVTYPVPGTYISPTEDVLISGTISDQNGPLYIDTFFVTPTLTDILEDVELDSNETINASIVNNRDTTITDSYVSKFEAKVNLMRNSGVFIFTFNFRDRFGNARTITARYNVDNIAPTVGLNSAITTFKRVEDDVILTGPQHPGTTADTNKENLANGVVDFRVNASDNFTVEAVRWWLLPVDKRANQSGIIAIDNDNDSGVANYFAYPNTNVSLWYGKDEAVPVDGAYGYIDWKSTASDKNRVVIDSTRLLRPDGEYRLHIIALDSAGNQSAGGVGGIMQQPIFFLQEQDKPYFSGITPNDSVIDRTGLTIQGVILEDDGFVIDEGPVYLWWSKDEDAETDPDLVKASPAASKYTKVPIPVKSSHLSLQGSDISLKIDLTDVEYEIDFATDGIRHIVIEASDSLSPKMKPDGSKPETDMAKQAARLKHIAFILDTVPPAITLTAPQANSVFGGNANSTFSITGTLTDVNPDVDVDGNYYISYWLSGWTESKTLSLRGSTAETGSYIDDVSPAIDGVTKVITFTIPADVVTSEMFDFDNIDEILHVLTLVAKDKSGKEGTCSLNFTKDTSPPGFSLFGIDKRELPIGKTDSDFNVINGPNSGDTGWWTEPANAGDKHTWNQRKYDWLFKAHPGKAIMISNDISVPELSGSFEDSVSDIEKSSVQFWLDNAPEASPSGDYSGMSWNGSGKTVNWTLPLTGLANGAHTIRFRVQDTAGNIFNSGHYVFIIDSAVPRNTIADFEVSGVKHHIFGVDSASISSGFSSGTIFTLEGSATDANLKDVGLKIVESGSGGAKIFPYEAVGGAVPDYLSLINDLGWTFQQPDPALNDDPAAAKFAWEYQFTTAFYTQLAGKPTNPLVDGRSYDIVTIATDQWGKTSETAVWSFIVTAEKPVIAFDGSLKDRDSSNATLTPVSFDPTAADAPTAALIADYRNVLSGTSPVIRGTVTGQASPARALQFKMEKWDYITGTWMAAPAWNSAWSDLGGPYAANTQMQVNWSYTLTGFEQGFYRMRLQAKNATYNEMGNGNEADGTYIAGIAGNPSHSGYLYFFYDNGAPDLEPAGRQYYSARQGTLDFTATMADLNRFSQVKAEVDVHMKNSGNKTYTFTWPLTNKNTGPAAPAAWDLKAALPYQVDGLDIGEAAVADYVLDGNYTMVFTATDMAGNSTSVGIPFTLDNTRPEGGVTYPAQRTWETTVPQNLRDRYTYASVTVQGGAQDSITGQTLDPTPGTARTESGVIGVWYHLGFADNKAEFPEPQDLWGGIIPAGKKDTGEYNDLFDAAANAAAGNKWFRLHSMFDASDIEIPRIDPTGFYIDSNPNIFDWRITVGTDEHGAYKAGFKHYADKAGITIKGQPYIPVETYNGSGAGGRKLVERVDDDAAPGVYRMPMWIRVADSAGNITYFCRDIWIDPDADIPKTTILNPQNSIKDSPRGGSVSADGTAENIVSVYAVIYRVWVDGKLVETADVDYATNTPLVFDNGKLMADNEYRNWDGMKNIITNEYSGKLYDALGGGSKALEGWHLANSQMWGSAKVPWDFTFNTNREITDLIPVKGFPASGSGPNDTIRVRLEVLVFKGDQLPQLVSIGNGTTDDPQPYIRTFYINETAPSITTPEVSQVGTDFAAPVYENYTTRVLRGGQFIIRALLKATDSGAVTDREIRQVSVRRYDDDPSFNLNRHITAWQGGSYVMDAANASNLAVPGLTIEPSGVRPDWLQLTYRLDSALTAPANPGSAVNSIGAIRGGAWKELGGSYRIEIRIRDNATPQNAEAIYTFTIGIDNFAPVADEHRSHRTPGKVAGSVVPFFGRALDYQGTANSMAPEDRKVSKVYAWFTKTKSDGEYYVGFKGNGRDAPIYAPVSGFTGVAGYPGNTADNYSVYVGREAKVGTWTLPTDPQLNERNVALVTPGTAGLTTYPTGDYWAMDISEATAMPGSGIAWTPNYDYDIDWRININTTLLPDGPITLNYLIYDEAGNATFYQQNTVVMNRYPAIDSVTLYTDNSGIGAVYVYEFDTMDGNVGYMTRQLNPSMMTEGYWNSGFISKNEHIGFMVKTVSGNSPLHYQARYVTRKQVPLSLDNLNAMIAIKNGEASSTYYSAAAGRLTGKEINLFTTTPSSPGASYSNNYSTAAWGALGVVKFDGSEVRAGTHFTFTPDSMTGLTANTGVWVWAYTPVITNDPIVKVPNNDEVGRSNPNFVFANDSGLDKDNFGIEVNGGIVTTKPGPYIGQFDGSHPGNVGGIDNADKTAFFLIKVWDTVNEIQPNSNGVYPAGTSEFDMLYDAVVIGMNVYQVDPYEPAVRMYDLNPYTETAVRNNNNDTGTVDYRAQTIAQAADPKGIGKNILRGGLFNINTTTNAVKSGHIEPRQKTTALTYPFNNPGLGTDEPGAYDRYESGTGLHPTGYDSNDNASTGVTFTYDQVSGRVILRGIAYDNQLIKYIDIKTGDDPWLTILELDETTRKMTAPAGVEAFAQELLHWKNGHTVEWAYVWDTSKKPASLNGGPSAGQVNVAVRVIDYHGATATYNDYGGASKQGGYPSDTVTVVNEEASANIGEPVQDKKFHNEVMVDIVPYITGFERDSRFATKRSLQGWYSFYQGETNIAALGYNLHGTADTRMRVFTGASASYALTTTAYSATANAAAQAAKTNYTKFQNHVKFNVPATASSGQIVLMVNGSDADANNIATGSLTGAQALNHRTGNDGKSWNSEYGLYTNGSELWINKPHAHIWRSAENATSPATYFVDSAALERPAMALEYTGTNAGRLLGVWASYANAAVYRGYNNGAARTNIENTAGEPFAGTDVSLYNGTNNAGVVYAYEVDGTPNLRVKVGTAIVNGTGNVDVSGNPAAPTKRWQHNRIVMRDNTNYYVTSYDSFNRRLLFTQGLNTTAGNVVLVDGDGSVDAGDNMVGAATADAGAFSAVDYDSGGYPVIAYYDRANDTLRLAYRGPANGWTSTRNFTTTALTTPGRIANNSWTNNNNWNPDDLGNVQSTYFTQAGHGLSVGDVVWWSSGTNATEDISTAVQRYVLWVDGNNFRVSNTFDPAINKNNVFNTTGRYTYWRVPRDNNYAANTRYFTYANHGLVAGDTVRIGSATGTERTVLWADTNNFKLSSIASDDAADVSSGVWNVNTPTIAVYAPTIVWTRKTILDPGSSVYKGSGKYVSMKIDTNDNIHLAFLNSELGKVVYAVGKKRDATFTAYPVDNVVQGGTWTDISVDDDGNPWIVYGDTSRTLNRDGIRIAYRTSGGTYDFGGNIYDPDTGAAITAAGTGWEALTMPSDYTVNDDRLNIEVWPPVNRGTAALGTAPTWNAAVGYGSNMFRLAYFYKPAYKGYTQ